MPSLAANSSFWLKQLMIAVGAVWASKYKPVEMFGYVRGESGGSP